MEERRPATEEQLERRNPMDARRANSATALVSKKDPPRHTVLIRWERWLRPELDRELESCLGRLRYCAVT